MYAEVSRKLLEIQNSYIDHIAEELVKIHPDINDVFSSSAAEDWACDITSSTNNESVVEILDRLESRLIKNRNSNLSNEETLKIKIKELQNYIKKLEDEKYQR
jgi:hypothetical protein